MALTPEQEAALARVRGKSKSSNLTPEQQAAIARVRQPVSVAGPQQYAESMKAPLEAGMQVASATLAEPVSGLVGLMSTMVPGAPPAGDVVRNVQQAMTYQPRTPQGQRFIPEIVQDISNAVPDFVKGPLGKVSEGYSRLAQSAAERFGPAAGAAIETAPTALLEAVPAGMAIRKTRQMAQPAPPQFAPQPQVMPQAAPQTVSGIGQAATPEQLQSVSDIVRSGDVQKIIPEVKPDAQILEDAKVLGIDLNPANYSTNRAYIETEQALKSRPGSLLQSVEEKAIIDLGNRADELIEQIGGQTDKSVLDVNIMDEFNQTLSDLWEQDDKLRTIVNDAIPKATRVTPTRTAQFVQTQLDDVGGNEKLLTSAERRLLELATGTPTYAALDRVRRDIGSAIGQRQGIYKDDDVGKLKQIYEVLSEDQLGFADAFGVGDNLRDANALTRLRKRMEEQSIALYGKELQGSIIPKLRQSATALTRGDVSQLEKLMASVPEPRRQEVAATLLNDIFSAGARRNAPIGQGFVNAFEGLNRNKGAKDLLFSYLPENAKERFDRIGRVATGIYRAKALENNSRTARDVIAAMDDGGLFRKMYGLGKQVAVAEGVSSAIGIPGAGTAGVIGSVIARAATPATKAADELLTSNAFRSAVNDYALGAGAKAQSRLQNTPEYNAWLDAQGASVKREIAAIGLIPWLTGAAETRQEQPARQ